MIRGPNLSIYSTYEAYKEDLGPVPRKMVKFNSGLSKILSNVFLLRACNSRLQNTVEPLL